MKLLVPIIGVLLLTGCSHPAPPPDGQGGQLARDGLRGDVVDEGTKMDGVRRIRSGIANADSELERNPTMQRREQLEAYKQQAYKDACGLWKQVDEHDLDADLLQWGKATCE